MKMKFLCISITVMFFAACSENQNGGQHDQSGTHAHDDGSVHVNHDETDTLNQEVFTPTADSVHAHEDSAQHSHDGHEHPHLH